MLLFLIIVGFPTLNVVLYQTELFLVYFQEAQFLSDVGGAIGLWIGLSILAICEIFQLIFELCDYGVHRIRKRQMKKREKERERNQSRNRKRKFETVNFGISGSRSWPYGHFNHYSEKEKHYSGESVYKRRLRHDYSIDMPRQNSYQY